MTFPRLGRRFDSVIPFQAEKSRDKTVPEEDLQKIEDEKKATEEEKKKEEKKHKYKHKKK